MSKIITDVLAAAPSLAAIAASGPSVAAPELSPETLEKLKVLEKGILTLGRRSTEQGFELAELYDRGMNLLQPGQFENWVKHSLGVSVRTAFNYVAIHRNLPGSRDRLVDLAASPTVLIHLAAATPEQVEEALELGEDKGRLTVADVKAVLSKGKDSEGKAADMDVFFAGGTAGLKGLIAIKARDGMKLFSAHVDAVCNLIHVALGKKRVIKEQLFKESFEWARLAREELESLALFVNSELDFSLRHRPMRFPMNSHWWRVNEILTQLGGIEAWPKSAAVRGWLELEVLPILEWATSKERKPKWPIPDKVEVAPADRDHVEDHEFNAGLLEDTLEADVDSAAEPERYQLDDVPPLAADDADAGYDGEDDDQSDEPEAAEEEDLATHAMR